MRDHYIRESCCSSFIFKKKMKLLQQLGKRALYSLILLKNSDMGGWRRGNIYRDELGSLLVRAEATTCQRAQRQMP
jgi:hypothetical protein